MVSKPTYVLWKTFLNWNTYLVKMKIKMIVQNGFQLIVLLQRSFLIRLPSHVQCCCTCTAFRSTSERLRGRRHHTVISSEIPKYFALFDMTGLSQTTGLEVLFTPLRWHFLPNKYKSNIFGLPTYPHFLVNVVYERHLNCVKSAWSVRFFFCVSGNSMRLFFEVCQKWRNQKHQ